MRRFYSDDLDGWQVEGLPTRLPHRFGEAAITPFVMATKTWRPSRTPMKCLLTILVAVGLTGCNTTSAMVDQGKYTLYNCRALNEAIKSEKEKEQKLRILMEKSSRGPGGEFVNLIAYRTEYLNAQGYQELASPMLRAKDCPKGR